MFVDLKNALCIVVGGGKVAYRKVKALLEFEATVVVISPIVCDEIIALAGEIKINRKNYETLDLENAYLVIAATADPILNARISVECTKRKIPVNVVDVQKECSFIFPAYIKKGPLTVGVTSSGKSPILSKQIKTSIKDSLPDYLEELIEILGELREEVKLRFDSQEQRKMVFKQLVELGCLKQGNLSRDDIQNTIQKVLEQSKWEGDKSEEHN